MSYTYQNEGLERGMYYVPKDQELVHAIDYFSAQIGQNNQLLLANVQQMIEKSKRANRKKRKSKVGEQLSVSKEGSIFVLRTFDDGSNESVPFLKNLTGNPEYYKVEFKGISNFDTVWGIYFRQQNIWIFQKKKNVSGNTLYTNFIKAGAIFNSLISEAQIKRLLFETLVAGLEATENTVEIPALAGWYKGKFKSAETMNKILKGDVPLLPIVQKNFARIQPNEGAWEEYFYLMRNIPDWKERLVIMLYPVMSILSSVLKENNFQLMTSLNLILVKDFPIRHILSWFQVFNRDKLKLMDDSITNSALMKESLLLKDEVLIVDLREHEGETYYQKTSRSRKYKKLVRYMEQGEIVSGLVGVSNNIVFDARVFNFYIDDRYTTTVSGEEAMRGEKAIEVFFSCLVDFVERKMDTVIDCLRTNRKYGEAGLFRAVFQVIKNFWEKEGINLEEAAKLPSEIDFNDLVLQKTVETSELMDLFRQAVRKRAKTIHFVKKNGTEKQAGVLFDSNYLWISTEILNKTLMMSGIMTYKNQLLLELKGLGILDTDGHGLSRRVQYAGTAQEYYKISRSFFNTEGLVDIVHLGREIEEYDG